MSVIIHNWDEVLYRELGGMSAEANSVCVIMLDTNYWI